MDQRNSIYKLDGDVQADDAYLGGEKPGKTGRGAGNKNLFVIAVATRNGKPTLMQLRRVAAFTTEAIKQYAKTDIVGRSWVLSDALPASSGSKRMACATSWWLPAADGGRILCLSGAHRPWQR